MGYWKRYWEEQEELDPVWLALQNLGKARDKVKKLVRVKRSKSGSKKKAKITQQERNKAL